MQPTSGTNRLFEQPCFGSLKLESDPWDDLLDPHSDHSLTDLAKFYDDAGDDFDGCSGHATCIGFQLTQPVEELHDHHVQTCDTPLDVNWLSDLFSGDSWFELETLKAFCEQVQQHISCLLKFEDLDMPKELRFHAVSCLT